VTVGAKRAERHKRATHARVSAPLGFPLGGSWRGFAKAAPDEGIFNLIIVCLQKKSKA
jgi:hypothetical protein